jgi:hypothetical protein
MAPWLPSAVFAASSLLAAVVTLVLPETGGVQLAERMQDVDIGPLFRRIRQYSRAPQSTNTTNGNEAQQRT